MMESAQCYHCKHTWTAQEYQVIEVPLPEGFDNHDGTDVGACIIWYICPECGKPSALEIVDVPGYNDLDYATQLRALGNHDLSKAYDPAMPILENPESQSEVGGEWRDNMMAKLVSDHEKTKIPKWRIGQPCPNCGHPDFSVKNKRVTMQMGQLSPYQVTGTLSCDGCGWYQGQPLQS